jgi:hypothetical protein
MNRGIVICHDIDIEDRGWLYRLMYGNGYQVGYYSKSKQEDLSTANDKLGKK